jgi:predicted nucleic acid-binding protein
MPVKVVDASAVAAVVFGEPEAETVAVIGRDFTLASPTLLPFEIANVCMKKIRRRPDERSALLAAYRLFCQLDIALAEIKLDQVILLAEKIRLSVYDASYLWLARELDAELITLDKALSAAAKTRA